MPIYSDTFRPTGVKVGKNFNKIRKAQYRDVFLELSCVQGVDTSNISDVILADKVINMYVAVAVIYLI